MLGMKSTADYRRCESCGTSIQGKRSDARYCGDRCRQRAHRAAVELTATPIVPAAVPKRQRKPSVEDVAGMFLAAAGLEVSFRFASEKADYRLRAMCARMAAAIGAAMAHEKG